ncbi:VRR-NUC domain-containing protein [Paraburkholderia sp.]|uniref:VRR-NUC domain-containing protein n=1 Tax=Paraburkholderia sp. TaxID=1926495 RepID=UPI00238DA52C|nr:VRR-NUC domain-containing protein [Paraburkholderia sp.]MDE1181664.1 VRR-NUC domain-containing protein [Paraburkholderia sp.]
MQSPYYLSNFERALDWIAGRYDDLLDADERAFIAAFRAAPLPSRALLVRMLMRQGTLFRANRLSYAEIGSPFDAAVSLIEMDWVDPAPHLTLDELFALTTRPELLKIFPHAAASKAARKCDWLAALKAVYPDARPYSMWHPAASSDDCILHVTVAPLCERLRLMFFGNLHQDWSEFVLADLGVYHYERVSFAASSRAFQRREDVDAYLALHACRAALDAPNACEDTAAVAQMLEAISSVETCNPWVESRRAKLLFRIGYQCERQQQWDTALTVYARSAWPGARHRSIRVLERSGRHADALALATHASTAPESEEESQRIARMLPRLLRHTGQTLPRARRAASIERNTIVIARPVEPITVEYAARDHIGAQDAPVYYVENALINSLFGLLCWEPIFAALPGAFFHPFQRGPADLHAPDFHARRASQFAECLAQLDNDTHRDTIRRHWHRKSGLQSPFVFWGALDESLLTLALDCIPAAHLKRCFERLLHDLRGNRSGFPDLIRFWPNERRYEMIEVKGPGDRLQDNQIRWLDYCVQHGMPVRVLDVRWMEDETMPVMHTDASGACETENA